jgi:iron complex outermembrane receptor protein
LNIWNSRQAQAVLQGGFSTGAVRHEVVVGANGQRLELDIGTINDTSWAANSVSSNLYDPTRLVWAASPFAGNPNLYRGSEYRQSAVFASDTISWSDRWSLLGGLRYTRYKQASFDALNNIGNTYEESPITPTVALMYKPRPSATLYTSYVESLEQGSQVSELYANGGELLPPLKSKQYEAGFKVERSDYRASGALFRIERGAEYATTQNVLVQNGIVQHDGVELGGDLRLGRGWTVGGDVMWLDAAYAEGDPVLEGSRVQGTPKFIATAEAGWEIQAVPGLSMHIDAKYTSSIPVNNGFASSALIDAVVPSYTLVNLGSNFRTALGGHDVTWRAQIHNITDEEYWQGGFFILTPGAPRTLALSVQLDL